MTLEHITDIDTIGKVIADLGEISDTLDVETGVDALEALAALRDKIRAAEELIVGHLSTTMERGGREINGRRYRVNEKRRDRYDHARVFHAIRTESVASAIDKETGEMKPAAEIVDYALGMAQDAYVSPSTRVKHGFIEVIGLSVDDHVDQPLDDDGAPVGDPVLVDHGIRTREKTGSFELVVTDPKTRKPLKLGEGR